MENIFNPIRNVRPRWMLVDDNEPLLFMMQQLLSMNTEAEVIAFTSAEEALRTYEENPAAFDVVITDLDMPGMNGIELCDQMRRLAPELKAVLITGNTDMSEAEVLRHGFLRMLRKPFSTATLLEAIDTIRITVTEERPAKRVAPRKQEAASRVAFDLAYCFVT